MRTGLDVCVKTALWNSGGLDVELVTSIECAKYIKVGDGSRLNTMHSSRPDAHTRRRACSVVSKAS